MKQCWRWFGPDDPISLNDLHQVGVEGIVTALHHIPPGQVWTRDNIAKRQDMLRASGYDRFTLAEIQDNPQRERLLEYYRALWVALQT